MSEKDFEKNYRWLDEQLTKIYKYGREQGAKLEE